MVGSPRRATFTTVTRPLWRLRLARELPRYLLCALSAAGLAASARYAIAPPPMAGPVAIQRGPAPRDQAAEAFAVLFARRYLTWDAADPQGSARALAPFAGAGMELDAGLQLPLSGRQQVKWAEVVQQRVAARGEHVYTVAAQTDAAGLLYMTVRVARVAGGSLALSGYPAFVGAPSASPAQLSGHQREVTDPALAIVVERTLRNYLAASDSELAADLTSGARVSLPAVALSLESVQRLDWSPDDRSVVAVLRAQDARGVQYTLAYEVDVVHAQGRWEVSAVQMDPGE
jgi:hypothetical protein